VQGLKRVEPATSLHGRAGQGIQEVHRDSVHPELPEREGELGPLGRGFPHPEDAAGTDSKAGLFCGLNGSCPLLVPMGGADHVVVARSGLQVVMECDQSGCTKVSQKVGGLQSDGAGHFQFRPGAYRLDDLENPLSLSLSLERPAARYEAEATCAEAFGLTGCPESFPHGHERVDRNTRSVMHALAAKSAVLGTGA